MRLLLKIIEEHKVATNNNINDGKKMLRAATMMTILENIRLKIQSSHPFQIEGAEKILIRRCSSNSDFQQKDVGGGSGSSSGGGDNHDHHIVPIDEERDRLRKSLDSSLAQRRSLEIFFTNLRKERDMMSNELSKKVNLMNGMEEFVQELEAENQSFSVKVRECVFLHGTEESDTKDVDNIVQLREKNRALSNDLQCTRDRLQSIKAKTKELNDQNNTINGQMSEISGEVNAALQRLNRLKQIKVASDEIAQLEQVLECFQRIR